MMRLITYFTILLTLQIECSGQNFFNSSDTVFEIGQIKRIQINYELSGGCHPTIESVPLLDSIFSFLQKNKTLKIEIGAHTDYYGSSIMNNSLTEMRASRVKAYLIKKAIDITRVEHKGYGEDNPVVVDERLNDEYPFLEMSQKLTREYIEKLDTSDKQRIANMLNRRTEIKITRTNSP